MGKEARRNKDKWRSRPVIKSEPRTQISDRESRKITNKDVRITLAAQVMMLLAGDMKK